MTNYLVHEVVEIHMCSKWIKNVIKFCFQSTKKVIKSTDLMIYLYS